MTSRNHTGAAEATTHLSGVGRLLLAFTLAALLLVPALGTASSSYAAPPVRSASVSVTLATPHATLGNSSLMQAQTNRYTSVPSNKWKWVLRQVVKADLQGRIIKAILERQGYKCDWYLPWIFCYQRVS